MATYTNYKSFLHKFKQPVEPIYSEDRMKVNGSFGIFGGSIKTTYEKDIIGYKNVGDECEVCGYKADKWVHDSNFQFIKPTDHRTEWEQDVAKWTTN